MSATASASDIIAPKLGYGISDADQHFYEAPDSITKYLAGPFSLEFAGRHRYRVQDRENIRGNDFDGLFDMHPHDVFLVKISKWFSL